MSEITRAPALPIVRVGVDLAKLVIQVHAVDAAGRRVVSRALKRDQFIAWCAQLAGDVRGGDGGLYQRASLGTQAARCGVGCTVDRRPLRQPVPDGGQER